MDSGGGFLRAFFRENISVTWKKKIFELKVLRFLALLFSKFNSIFSCIVMSKYAAKCRKLLPESILIIMPNFNKNILKLLNLGEERCLKIYSLF